MKKLIGYLRIIGIVCLVAAIFMQMFSFSNLFNEQFSNDNINPTAASEKIRLVMWVIALSSFAIVLLQLYRIYIRSYIKAKDSEKEVHL